MRVRPNTQSCATIIAVAMLSLAACNSPDRTAPPPRPASSPLEQVVFEGSYSPSGTFRVYRTPEGKLGLSVGGKIDVDDMASVGGRLEESFARSYLNLRPDLSAAPAALLVLDEQAGHHARSHGLTAPSATPGSTVYSRNTFNSNACANLYSWVSCSGDYWSPELCNYWDTGGNWIWTGGGYGYGAGQQSAGWNVDSSASAQHSLYDPNTNTFQYPRTIAAGYWQWNSWGVSAGGVALNAYPAWVNALGITIHKYVKGHCYIQQGNCNATCESGDELCVEECREEKDACLSRTGC